MDKSAGVSTTSNKFMPPMYNLLNNKFKRSSNIESEETMAKSSAQFIPDEILNLKMLEIRNRGILPNAQSIPQDTQYSNKEVENNFETDLIKKLSPAIYNPSETNEQNVAVFYTHTHIICIYVCIYVFISYRKIIS